MKIKVLELPDWSFWTDEVSAGVYRVVAKHKFGSTIDLTSTEPEDIILKAKEDAFRMQKDIENKYTP